MIEIKNISKNYQVGGKPFYALDRVSLSVKGGEMIAIMGKSGAGKSTLLHILGCLERFEEGVYNLNGENVTNLSPKQLAKIRNAQIGFVLQDYSLINHKTALYNVISPMLFNKTPYKQMKPKALEALRTVGIVDQAEKDVVNMSGGQRQRVAIARAIVNSAPLILADEPTGNLDSTTTDEIMKLFCELHKQGKTIVIVTHDDHVASYCDRIITISDGKILKN